MGPELIVGLIISLASTAMSTMQAQSNLKRQAKAQADAANRAAKERWEQYERDEKKRKDQLKKNLAKRRARMGAQGLSAADGSAGAIIQGMRTDAVEASQEDFQKAEQGIPNSFSDIQQNLLETNDKIKSNFATSVGNDILGSAQKGMQGSEP